MCSFEYSMSWGRERLGGPPYERAYGHSGTFGRDPLLSVPGCPRLGRPAPMSAVTPIGFVTPIGLVTPISPD
jgi:hypothetical protein